MEQLQQQATNVTYSVVVTTDGVREVAYSGLSLRAASALANSVNARSERGVEVEVVPEETKPATVSEKRAYYEQCIARGATTAQAALMVLSKFFN